MQTYLLHKRFTIQNEALSFSGGYWYVQVSDGFAPITNEIDSDYKQPDDIP